MAVKIIEPVKTRFGALVADMSPRDRKMFLGLIVALYVGVLGFALWLGGSLVSDARSRVDARESVLGRLRVLEAQYLADAAEVAAIEDILRKNADQDFQAYVEKAAEKTGVTQNLRAVREKGMTQEGTLQVKTYAVDVDKVTLQQLTDFLYEVEAGGYPLRIDQSRIKTSGTAGSKLMNAAFEVSAYRLEEGAAAAPQGGE